jgi:hypothetical protein
MNTVLTSIREPVAVHLSRRFLQTQFFASPLQHTAADTPYQQVKYHFEAIESSLGLLTNAKNTRLLVDRL